MYTHTFNKQGSIIEKRIPDAIASIFPFYVEIVPLFPSGNCKQRDSGGWEDDICNSRNPVAATAYLLERFGRTQSLHITPLLPHSCGSTR